MNVLSDRLVNLFGALAVGITDRIKKAAFDPTIPGGGETTAATVVIGHATGLSIDELGRVLGLSHAGTVRLVDRLVAAGFAVRSKALRDRRAVALMLTEQARLAYLRSCNEETRLYPKSLAMSRMLTASCWNVLPRQYLRRCLTTLSRR